MVFNINNTISAYEIQNLYKRLNESNQIEILSPRSLYYKDDKIIGEITLRHLIYKYYMASQYYPIVNNQGSKNKIETD